MTRTLALHNRQRRFRVDTRLLKQIAAWVLDNEFPSHSWDIEVYLIGATRMAEINQEYLQHEGSTDIITFDYGDPATHLHGELFISLDDAERQAHEFNTTWQTELTRYVIHGILHLAGYDDLEPVARKKMKQAENRLVRQVARRFPLSKLGARTRLRP
jgi:rRNA maturation RNase YbeY